MRKYIGMLLSNMHKTSKKSKTVRKMCQLQMEKDHTHHHETNLPVSDGLPQIHVMFINKSII